MDDISMTEVIQNSYDRAKEKLIQGKLLPINNIEDLCHVAHTYAIMDLYHDIKRLDTYPHYNKAINELYKLFDEGIISEKDSYASFAFCYRHR